MVTPNRLAIIGRLVGDPTRAAMITALMDGRALTAKELALSANVTPQTASSHLARLTQAALVKAEKQGRHRYHRLASPDVATLVEHMMEMSLTTTPAPKRPFVGTRDKALRSARTCYDHFAGRLGVAITDALINKRVIEFGDEAGVITTKGERFLTEVGISLQNAHPKSRRPICRPCLDWTERRHHLGGRLGAAICTHFFEQGYVRRQTGSRAVTMTRRGQCALKDVFGLENN